VNGTIIMLNGTSSSGKSSLVKALQELLEEPFLDAGLDRFLWMLPPRYLRPPLWDEVLGRAVEAGPAGHQLVSGLHHTLAALSRAGCNVIADHVLVEPRWLEECSLLFRDLPAYLVGVHCPLAVLEERERQRKDRTLGQARAQFSRVHAHGVYDIEVDTSTASPEACARRIKARLEDGPGPVAFQRLRERWPSII
jgi:chloramphenicol 3-O phosphotransferase